MCDSRKPSPVAWHAAGKPGPVLPVWRVTFLLGGGQGQAFGAAGSRSGSRGMAMIPAAQAGLPCSDVTYKEGSGDMARPQYGHLWALAHAERAALAEDLAGLGAEQWRHDTLCGEWDVEQVVAHLTAAASLNQWQWLRSMLGARFRPDVHNQRRLAEHCGSTPAETLDRFRAVITSTTAPSRHTPAYLGEVVVHAQDIRQPLGIVRTPSVDAMTPVAGFFARRDFTVASRTRVADLQLRADDGPFATGTGLLVTGSTLALVMSMAGRQPYLAELDGPGVPTLRSRLQAAAA
jgi:uncharacterized protein (TIGR03083 family)